MRPSLAVALALGLPWLLGFDELALACTTTEECAAGFECVGDDVLNAVAEPTGRAADGGLGDAPPASGAASDEPLPVLNGTCQRLLAEGPVTCKVSADCPEPTLCGDDGRCWYEIAECSDDVECERGYSCLRIVSVDPESPRTCFPNHVPCDEDAQCSEDWWCIDVPETGSPPEGWERAERGCVPPGIALALEGIVGVKTSMENTGSSPAECAVSPLDCDLREMGPLGIEPAADVDSPETAPQDDALDAGERGTDMQVTGPSVRKDGGGCAFWGGSPSGHYEWWMLVGVLLVTRGRRARLQ